MTAKRYDDGKSPVVEGCFRYFPRALLAVGDVSAFGSNKYKVPLSDKNWLGLEQDRIVNSEGRHLLKEEIEGPYDSESLLLHKAHKAWNALADLEKELMAGTELRLPIVVPPIAAALIAAVAMAPVAKGVGFKNDLINSTEFDGNKMALVCENCGETYGKHIGRTCTKEI